MSAFSQPDAFQSLYTFKDAANYLRVSRRTIDRYVRNGELPCVRIGRKGPPRIRFEALLGLLTPEAGHATVADALDDFIGMQAASKSPSPKA